MLLEPIITGFYHLSLYNRSGNGEIHLCCHLIKQILTSNTLHSNLKIMIKFPAKRILKIDVSSKKKKKKGDFFFFLMKANLFSTFICLSLLWCMRVKGRKLSSNSSKIFVFSLVSVIHCVGSQLISRELLSMTLLIPDMVRYLFMGFIKVYFLSVEN